MKSKEKLIRYTYNPTIKNYCVVDSKGNFIEPLETLKLKGLDRNDFVESLQAIFYKRTGNIDYRIGINKDYDIELAKQMNCWE